MEDTHIQACDEERLCKTYLSYLRRHQEKDFWAYEKIDALSTHAHINEIWSILLKLTSLADSRRELSLLGAGLLENLIKERGQEIFSLLEDELGENPRLQWSFSAVWMFAKDSFAEKVRELQNDFDVNDKDPLSGTDITDE